MPASSNSSADKGGCGDLKDQYKPVGIQAVSATATCRYGTHVPTGAKPSK